MEKQIITTNETNFEVTENDRAAHILNDELFKVEYAIQNAHAIISDMTIDFFDIQLENFKEDAWKVVCEFQRYKPYANMLFDYVIQAKEAIEEIRRAGEVYHEYAKADREKSC